MTKQYKTFIISLSIGISVIGIVFVGLHIATAQVSPAPIATWDGTGWVPFVSTEHWGSSATRWQADLATTTIEGDLTVNTNRLFVDQSTGRVGIGTTTLSTTFNVQGDISVFDDAGDPYFRIGDSTTAFGVLLWDSANDKLKIYTSTGIGYLPISYDGSQLEFNVSGSEKMRLDTTGYLGIASTTPSDVLSVSGGIMTDDNIWVYGTADNYFGGQVGIGTTGPSEKLHLESADSNKPILRIETTHGGNTPSQIYFVKDSASPDDNDWLGAINFFGDDSGGTETNFIQIAGICTDYTNDTEDGEIRFRTMTAGTLTNTMSLVNGNVGIGTTGPDRKLDVLDDTNPQVRLTHTDGSVYGDFQIDANGELTIETSGGAIKTNDTIYATSTIIDTSLEIPNATDPTVDAAGEIAVNTATSSIRYYDGANEMAVYPTFEKSYWLATTTPDKNGNTFNRATTTHELWNSSKSVTLVGLFCKTDTGTLFARCGNGTDWSESVLCESSCPTGKCEDDGSMVNNTFEIRDDFQCQVGSYLNGVLKVTITPEFKYTAD